MYATGVAFNFIILGNDGRPLKMYDKDNFPTSVSQADRSDGSILITDGDNNSVKLKPKRIKIYETREEDYFILTYIGFIYHNDDPNYKDSISPMKYGVVRNTTYQLSLNSINKLPFPNKPYDYYLSIDIKVKAWDWKGMNVSW